MSPTCTPRPSPSCRRSLPRRLQPHRGQGARVRRAPRRQGIREPGRIAGRRSGRGGRGDDDQGESRRRPPSPASRRGKHVLLEKPVAPTIAEVRALKAAADKAGRVCMPAHNYIYAPALRRAKQHLDAGDYGKVSGMWMMFNIQVGEDWGHAYGPVVPELCIHHVYSTLHFLGRPLARERGGFQRPLRDHRRGRPDRHRLRVPLRRHRQPVGCVAADDPTSDPWTRAVQDPRHIRRLPASPGTRVISRTTSRSSA